jgi:hypothetical protein
MGWAAGTHLLFAHPVDLDDVAPIDRLLLLLLRHPWLLLVWLLLQRFQCHINVEVRSLRVGGAQNQVLAVIEAVRCVACRPALNCAPTLLDVCNARVHGH